MRLPPENLLHNQLIFQSTPCFSQGDKRGSDESEHFITVQNQI